MNKTETHGFVNQLLVYTLVMICFTGSIGMGTVWLRQQMAQTANLIKQMEVRSDTVERRLAETNAQISTETSSDALTRRNAEWNLGLTAPKELQIVRVTDRVEDRLARKRHDQLFPETPALAQVKFVLGSSQ